MNEERAIKKASQSQCKFAISAHGFNKKGELVLSKTNRQRFTRKGGGLHAELLVLSQARRYGIKTIVICRVGKGGDLRPIHPCSVCQAVADKLKVKIKTIEV